MSIYYRDQEVNAVHLKELDGRWSWWIKIETIESYVVIKSGTDCGDIDGWRKKKDCIDHAEQTLKTLNVKVNRFLVQDYQTWREVKRSGKYLHVNEFIRR